MMPRATTTTTTTMMAVMTAVVGMSTGGHHPLAVPVTLTNRRSCVTRMGRMARAGIPIGVHLLIGRVGATMHQPPAVLAEGVVPTCLETFRGRHGQTRTDTLAALMLIMMAGVLIMVGTVMLKERRTRSAVPVEVARSLATKVKIATYVPFLVHPRANMKLISL